MNRISSVLALILTFCLLLTSCTATAQEADSDTHGAGEAGKRAFLTLADSEPDTVDPQCTTDSYLIALNVLDRLVEIRTGEDGVGHIEPSLAESWEVSSNGYVYTFHLREGVRFSNGSPLTSSDVLYSFARLLTNPYSCHPEVASCIHGAQELRNGNAQTLAGFSIQSDSTFSITLESPCASFLASLASPAASILDEETVSGAESMFGRTARHTVGTGPFVFSTWTVGEEMILTANPNCWSGAPKCAGIVIKIVADADQQSLLFKDGQLDVLDLEGLGSEAEYYIRNSMYRDRLFWAPLIGVSFIALNESVKPLDDVRVRKALQLALDRELLLTAVLSGRGVLENGIFPHGLLGFNPLLPELSTNQEAARRLLLEAGYADGFDLVFSIPSDADEPSAELAALAAAMWQKIGVHARVITLSPSAFADRKKSGKLACYFCKWSADCDDPDDFIYTFFGNAEKSCACSLCYGDEDVMRRVRAARSILNTEKRLEEYHDLERRIIQDDVAWIPLFSQQHYFVVSERVRGFRIAWNGSFDNCYRDVSTSG